MDILLDDRRVDSDFVGDRTLQEALRLLQTEMCDDRQVVVGLRCNGEPVHPNEMAATLARAASTFDKLEVFTSTKERLVKDAMSQAAAAIKETDSECNAIADLLTEGKATEGIQALGECLKVWQQVHQAVAQSVQMLRLDIENTTVNEERLVDLITHPKNVLLDVKAALESSDHVLLADIMRYEFSTVTEKWHDVITMLSQRAEELQAQAG